MKVTDEGYVLESTGRKINTRSADGLSLFQGQVRMGYDSYVEFSDQEPGDDPVFTAEEKTELATYMIDEWKQFGNLDKKEPAS